MAKDDLTPQESAVAEVFTQRPDLKEVAAAAVESDDLGTLNMAVNTARMINQLPEEQRAELNGQLDAFVKDVKANGMTDDNYAILEEANDAVREAGGKEPGPTITFQPGGPEGANKGPGDFFVDEIDGVVAKAGQGAPAVEQQAPPVQEQGAAAPKPDPLAAALAKSGIDLAACKAAISGKSLDLAEHDAPAAACSAGVQQQQAAGRQ